MLGQRTVGKAWAENSGKPVFLHDKRVFTVCSGRSVRVLERRCGSVGNISFPFSRNIFAFLLFESVFNYPSLFVIGLAF